MRGTTFAIHLNIHTNMYHLFRDNLAPLLYALYAVGISNPRDSGIRLLLLNHGMPATASDAALRFKPFLLPFFSAVTRHPAWVLPSHQSEACWRFERLIIGPLGTTTVGTCNHQANLRRALLAGLGIAPCKGEALSGPRLSFITRSKVSLNRPGRFVINEAAVLAALRRHSGHGRPTGTVQTVTFEQLPLHMQWQAVARTDVLVGVHGAGLANAIFLPRCGTLVEVVPAISKGKKPLLGMYTQTVSKGHHFALMDESGCCGFHYNLTLDLQNLSAVVEKAREKWWRCSAG